MVGTVNAWHMFSKMSSDFDLPTIYGYIGLPTIYGKSTFIDPDITRNGL